MNQDFYQSLTTFSFTLFGLWWGVVQFRYDDWIGVPARRRTAFSIMLSFLLPGVMGLGSLAAPDTQAVWQTVFVIAGTLGAVEAFLLVARSATGGAVAAVRWAIGGLYVLIVFVAFYPDLPDDLGTVLEPLEVEAIILSAVVFAGCLTSWLHMTERRPRPPGGAVDDAPREAY